MSHISFLFAAMDVRRFIAANTDKDVNALALCRSRYKELDDEAWRFALQQIDGLKRAKDKLPELYNTEGIVYPPHLNLEQCSSEATAQYKAQLLRRLGATVVVDLTGGFGVDSIALSRVAERVCYVERNEDLARVAEQNMRLLSRDNIEVTCSSAEDYLASCNLPFEDTLFYLDPARRSGTGSKVFLPEQCEPDFVKLLPVLKSKARHILLKLSPMLDLSAALRAVGGKAQTHIVSVAGEVKEVLLLVSPVVGSSVSAIDLVYNQSFRFSLEEEQAVQAVYADGLLAYIYEPSAALLKAGAFKCIATRYAVSKLDVNTHLYTSDGIVEHFPGHVFKVLPDKPQAGERYNIIVRNFPEKRESLIKRLKVKEGGTLYLFAFRFRGKPKVVIAERV